MLSTWQQKTLLGLQPLAIQSGGFKKACVALMTGAPLAIISIDLVVNSGGSVRGRLRGLRILVRVD
jgi:hypothetical protein